MLFRKSYSCLVVFKRGAQASGGFCFGNNTIPRGEGCWQDSGWAWEHDREAFEPRSCTASFGGDSPSAERAVGGAEDYSARKSLPKVFDGNWMFQGGAALWAWRSLSTQASSVVSLRINVQTSLYFRKKQLWFAKIRKLSYLWFPYTVWSNSGKPLCR